MDSIASADTGINRLLIGPHTKSQLMSAENTPADSPKPSRQALDAWFTPLRFGIGLAIALVVAFPDVVFGSGAFFHQDYGVLGYPVIHHHHHSFWSGDPIPLWNPYSNCGAPFMAQWGTMTLYPFSLFYLLLPLPWSLGVFCLIHLWLGGMGMYRLAHRRVDLRFAATLAGLIFVFNGFTLSCMQWPNYMIALGWLPWVALTVERACERGGRAIAIAAVVATLQMLSGVPEFIFMTWVIVVALQAVAIIEKRDRSFALLAGRRLAATVLLVTGLSAAQLLPFFELLSLSQRHNGFAAEKWAMPWHGVGNFFVPLFHCAKTYTGTFFQWGQSLIATYYLGLGAMTLATIGAFRGRTKETTALAGIAILSVILAMGENGYLYGLIKDLFPRLGFVRYPIKFLMPLVFVTPLLAAHGARWFMNRKPPLAARDGQMLLLFWIGTAAIMVTLILSVKVYWFPVDQPGETLKNAIWRGGFFGLFLMLILQSRRMTDQQSALVLRCSALVVIIADILTHMPSWNPRIAATEFRSNIAAEAQEFAPVAPKLGVSRIMLSPAAEALFLRSTIPDSTTDFQGKRLGFWSHLNLLDQIPKVNGSSTLQLRAQAEIQDLIYKNENPDFDATQLADFLAVSHVSSPDNPTDWIGRDSAAPWISVGRKPVFLTKDRILDELANNRADLKKNVLLPIDAQDAFSKMGANQARASVSVFKGSQIEIETHADGPIVLVLAQSFHPAWEASLNGKTTKIWPANHAFQAIAVPSGANVIQLTYRDSRFRLGLMVTFASILCCGILWFRQKNHSSRTTE